MLRPVVDLKIGPSGEPFYSVFLDVQMFVVLPIITYLSYFLGTLNTLNSSNFNN